MQLEPEKPAHRGFSAFGKTGECFMPPDTAGVADRQGCGIDVVDARFPAQAADHEKHQRHENPFLHGHKPFVAGHATKITSQDFARRAVVKILEIFVS
jgi:hypothetical protein